MNNTNTTNKEIISLIDSILNKIPSSKLKNKEDNIKFFEEMKEDFINIGA